MTGTKSKQSTRSLFYSAAVISLAAIGLWFGAQTNKTEATTNTTTNIAVPAATFAADAGSLGAVPDGTSLTPCSAVTPRNVTFTVSGLSGAPSNVEVGFTMGSPVHSFGGDIVAVLIAPNGASHTVFGRTLATSAASFGTSSDIAGPYTFKDSAAGTNWWTAAATTPIPSGDYKSTVPGPTTSPAPTTNITPDFAGVTNPNGTWTLRFTDCASGDTGSVSAATLNLTASAPPVAADANVDFNGDGKTDFVVARGTTTPLTEATAPSLAPIRRNVDSSAEIKTKLNAPKVDSAIAPPIYWYSNINGSGTVGVGQLGDAATDFIITEDFDGDTKDDLAVWTEAPATQANFKILQSSTNTVRVEFFGQTGDDPAVVGDYDGDNKADPAVFRCPAFTDPDGQCYFFYRGSLNNPSGNTTYVPWGFGVDGDFFPYVGDFDGDGKNDFCLQRANPASPANGQFVLLKSQGLGIEYINWGLSSDFLIPGDYDGDGKTDLAVRRSNDPSAGLRTYYILTRTGATSQAQWGVAGDISVPGDYDGDGKTDLAIWRPNADPTANFFWIRNSSNGSVTQFEWGQQGDFPVAGWAVH